MSTLNVDKVDPSTGTALEIGTSGDTITVPSGATFVVAGTTEITGTNNIQRPNAQPYMINGNFGVWQRGTSFTTSVYTADRWKQDLSGATATVTREAHTVGQTDVPYNPKYYLKQNVTTGNGNCGMLYKIEDVDTVIGTFTLSFYAKGVNPAGGNLDIVIQQNFGSGGSATVELTAQDLTLTGSWAQYVFTGTLASISGKTVGTSSYIQFIFKQPDDDTATDAWNLQISQIQFESGTYTSATLPAFQTETYGANLARCQRYFWTPKTAAAGNGSFAVGGFFNTTTGDFVCNLPCQMRDTYTVGYSALSDIRVTSHTAAYDASAIALNASAALDAICIRVTSGSVLAVAGNYGYVFLKNTSALLKIDAEF